MLQKNRLHFQMMNCNWATADTNRKSSWKWISFFLTLSNILSYGISVGSWDAQKNEKDSKWLAWFGSVEVTVVKFPEKSVAAQQFRVWVQSMAECVIYSSIWNLRRAYGFQAQ